MQVFRELAGYTFGHADVVRRAMSKKKADVMEAERESFVTGCAENGIPADVATALFDDLTAFAHYAFNKSHAAAYAVISYRTAYLKQHYPKAYFAALLTSELGNMPKIAEYIAEVGKRGVRVLPPDINESNVVFHVSGEHIRFGLLALKNVGRSFLEAVVEERGRSGPFRSFDDFLERMAEHDLNKRQIESLIQAGAFDNLGVYRSRLMAVHGEMIDRLQSRNRSNLTGQLDIFSTPGAERPEIEYPQLPEYELHELLRQEKEAAGMYFSGHMLDGFSKALSDPAIREIRDLQKTDADGEYVVSDRERATVAGIVTAMTGKTTKKDERMAFFTLEDRYGEIECLAFPKILTQFAHVLHTDAVIRVEGNLSLREDENVKLLVSKIEPLPDDRSYAEPQAPKKQEKPRTASIEQAKILYLRVPSLHDPLWARARNILEIFEGSLPVSVYDAENASYQKQELGFDCTAVTLRELEERLGADNVVLK